MSKSLAASPRSFTLRLKTASVGSGQRTGYTLVEVIMATGVFALAIVTSISALQSAFSNLDTARNIETACRIMQCELERERLLTWAEIGTVSDQPSIDPLFQSNPAVGGRFSLTRAVGPVADYNGAMRQITLTVTWRSYSGQTHQRTLTTYYGNNGLYTYYTTQS